MSAQENKPLILVFEYYMYIIHIFLYEIKTFLNNELFPYECNIMA